MMVVVVEVKTGMYFHPSSHDRKEMQKSGKRQMVSSSLLANFIGCSTLLYILEKRIMFCILNAKRS